MNKKHYNYISVVIAIIVLISIGLALYFVYHSVGLGANNALTDPSASPTNPLENMISKTIKSLFP